jgi:hypothetical protein
VIVVTRVIGGDDFCQVEYFFWFLYYDRSTQYDHLSTPAAYSTGSVIMDSPVQSASSLINDAPFPEL